jgi:hypothetical protein
MAAVAISCRFESHPSSARVIERWLVLPENQAFQISVFLTSTDQLLRFVHALIFEEKCGHRMRPFPARTLSYGNPSTRILMWWSTRQPDRYYVSYPYLQDGIPWMILGTAGIVGSATILSGRSKSNRWLWLPTLALLYFMLPPLHAQGGWFFHRAIHPMTGRPVQIAMERSFWDLTTISSRLVDRAKSAGAFTCQAEKLIKAAPSHRMG